MSLGKGHVIARLDELEDGKAVLAPQSDRQIIVLRQGHQVKAWSNACPHAGLPLSLPSGKVMLHDEGYIVCPVHGASFDIETGACAGGPAMGDSLEDIAVEIIRGEVRLA